jgi:hypothetical protein
LTEEKQTLKGVKGWLLLLCINLTILDPLSIITNLFVATDALQSQFERYPEFFQFILISGVCRIALMVFSIYAGVSLWKVMPGAVLVARKYLQAVLAYSVFAVFLPRIVGLPDELYRDLAAPNLLNSLLTICYVAAWFLYLSRSKRVKATYTTIDHEV